ncbi:MAG: chemotaxis protein CheA [Planctomycetota bacterium]
MVRDLASQSGKQVELVVNGKDTELDKSMVERLSDPLMHLMRNAVDHGIERTPEDREASGKHPIGSIELRAYHQGGSIYIEVEDDGRGIDRNRVIERARERGIIGEGEVPADRDAFNLIFEPGFSTAPEVTAVSGRGVGMDVVKRNIEEMRGSIEISSEPGLGTLFTIKLPLTIAIIDGMVVRVGEEEYIIPTLSIVRSIQPESGELSTVLESDEVIMVQGELVPLYHLGRIFDVRGAADSPMEGIVVIVEVEGRHFGFLTDELLGQQQIVIKSLGQRLRDIPGIAGGAVMANGRIGLIVDVAGLVTMAQTTADVCVAV